MAQPEFIERDVNQIVNEMVAQYEQLSGKTLQPAQVERLLINAFAYRESLIREKIQYAALQNLVEFSNAPVLDELGRLVGVTRLAASAATVEMKISLVPGHGGVTIPAETRVASTDNKAVFTPENDIIVPAGTNVVEVTCTSVSTGTTANGYALDTITNILDPLAFISAVGNTTVSGGGADQESDSALRERIKLAPSSFSNAGSKGAYKYFARSANPSIIDVEVLGPNDTPAGAPGEVNVYPLMEDGNVTPYTVLNQVAAAVNAEKVRPLTDLVNVIAPTRVDYELEVNLIIFNGYDATQIHDAVLAKLNAFALAKRKTLGQDIKMTQVIAQCMIDGVYDAEATLPGADIIISAIEYGYCVDFNVYIIGSTNG